MPNDRTLTGFGLHSDSQSVPWSNAGLQYRELRSEVNEAIARVLKAGNFVLSEDVLAFEEEFAAYCGVRYGITVHSGTDAIALALRALGIGEGDEVLLPDNSCASEPNAIMLSGATPVPVDIDEATYNMDPSRITNCFTPATAAIHAVHAYGHPCDMASINSLANKHHLQVIEDISLAPGASIDGKKVGSFADPAVASFGHGKILGAYGNGGGIVLTNSEELASQVKTLSRYGFGKSDLSSIDRKLIPINGKAWIVPGANSQMDAIQAAVLRVKLRYLDNWFIQREERAQWYRTRLADIDAVVPCIRDNVTSAHRGYIVRVKERNRVLASLNQHGIEARAFYLPPVHLQPAMSRFGYREGDFPVTEKVAKELLLLPIYPELREAQVDYVTTTLRKVL
ncbi:DegT/DnrJ/EryC1/StrS family aminotransferase [Candidatus Bipolaricaulota bacterium]